VDVQSGPSRATNTVISIGESGPSNKVNTVITSGTVGQTGMDGTIGIPGVMGATAQPSPPAEFAAIRLSELEADSSPF